VTIGQSVVPPRAIAETTFFGSGAAAGITAPNLLFLLNAPTSPETLLSFDSDGFGTITYRGPVPRLFQLESTNVAAAAGNNKTFTFAIVVNGVWQVNRAYISGTVISKGQVTRKYATGGDIGEATILTLLTLQPGDTVAVSVKNLTDATDITVSDLHLILVGLPLS
jgi:hypothetical protein